MSPIKVQRVSDSSRTILSARAVSGTSKRDRSQPQYTLLAHRDATDGGSVRRNWVYSRRAVIEPRRSILTHICRSGWRGFAVTHNATVLPMEGSKVLSLKGQPVGPFVTIIDGGRSSEIGNPDLGGLFEVWEDATFGLRVERPRISSRSAALNSKITRAYSSGSQPPGELVKFIIDADPGNVAVVVRLRVNVGHVGKNAGAERGEPLVNAHGAEIVVEILPLNRPLRSEHPF